MAALQNFDLLSQRIEAVGASTEALRQIHVALTRPNSDLARLQRETHAEEARSASLIREIGAEIKERSKRKGDPDQTRRLERLMKDFQTTFSSHQTMTRTVVQRLRTEMEKRATQPAHVIDEEAAIDARESSLVSKDGTELGEPLLQQLQPIVTSWDVQMQEEQLADLQDLERDLESLATVFGDLRTMVQEQQVNLDVIEDQVDQAGDRINQAVVHLDKAHKYQKSARTKMCIILCCLLVIAAIVVGVIGGMTGGFSHAL